MRKLKILKCITKNDLFEFLSVLVINFDKLLSCLKSVPWKLFHSKIPWTNKNAWTGAEDILFEYFWAGISKQYCHILNQHPRLFQKRVLNSFSEFWYRVCFYWDPLFRKIWLRLQVRVHSIKYALVQIRFWKRWAEFIIFFNGSQYMIIPYFRGDTVYRDPGCLLKNHF